MALRLREKSKGVWAQKSYSSLVYYLPILILSGLIIRISKNFDIKSINKISDLNHE